MMVAVEALGLMSSLYIACLMVGMVAAFSVDPTALTQAQGTSRLPLGNQDDYSFAELQTPDTRRSQMFDTAPADPNGDSTVLRMPLGHECNNTGDHVCMDDNAVCTNHTEGGLWRCVCEDAFYGDWHSQQCLKRQAPGGECNKLVTDNMCVHGAACHLGACECSGQEKVYFNDREHQCEPRRIHGETCDNNAPCVENANCNTNLCECEAHRFYPDFEGFCKARIVPDAACNDTFQCVLNTNCTSNVCKCVNGYHNSGHRCDPRLQLGSDCKDSDQCLHNGECVDSTCRCKNDSYKDRNNCHKTIGFNGACDYYNEELRQCLSNTSCVFRATDVKPICACDTDHFYDGHFCLQRAMALEPCPSDGIGVPADMELDKQCVENAHCNRTAFICNCDPDHYLRSGRCPHRIPADGTCDPWSDYPLQCQDGLVCHYGACKPSASGPLVG